MALVQNKLFSQQERRFLSSVAMLIIMKRIFAIVLILKLIRIVIRVTKYSVQITACELFGLPGYFRETPRK